MAEKREIIKAVIDSNRVVELFYNSPFLCRTLCKHLKKDSVPWSQLT